MSKKILFIINSLKNRSGSERVACILANEIVEKLKYDVKIINRDAGKSEIAYPLNSRVSVEKLSGSQFSFFSKLAAHIAKEKPDIVIVHNMGKLSLLCALIPNINKLVILEHVSFVSRPKLVQLLSNLLYKKVDQVVTLTKSDKQYFDKFHQQVTVIPNFSPFAVNTECDLSQNTIVAIGRLTDQKNYLHALKAWQKIYEMIPDWHFNIYGEGEQYVLLQDYIATHGIKNIHLQGATADIQSVYAASSFFVMSSKYEGLPMVLIEAQSFGLPIISYDCPNGPSDIITDESNGFLVENQNIDALAEKILQLAKSPLLLSKFSQNSLVNACNYQPEKIRNIWVEKVFKG